MPKMTHPELPDAEIDVAESAVPIHRQSGWRTDDENPKGKPASAASAKTEEK